MSTENEIPRQPSFGRRLLIAFKRLVIFTLRVLLVLLILGAIGVAIYLGAPVLINEYLLKDVKVNSEQIQDINAELKANTDFMNQRLADLQTRLETLEIQGDTDKQAIETLKAQLADAEDLIQEQSTSRVELGGLQASLDDYGEALALLDERISEQEDFLEDIQADLLTLGQSTQGNQEQLGELSAQLAAQAQVGTLRQELALLKVMELVTRARVSIGQGNNGLARDDLQAAQDLLTSLSAELPAFQAEYLANIAQRLALASENLTRTPSLVDEDLEVAWQLLLQPLPSEPEAAELTPTPGGEQSETPTPTPTPQP